MNHTKLIKSTLMGSISIMIAYSSLSFATDNKAMQKDNYFSTEAYAKQNKPRHEALQYRYQLNIDSLNHGLAKESIPLLKASPVFSRAKVMNGLLDKLGKLGLNVGEKYVEKRIEDDKKLAVYGDGWKLKVYGDGSRVTFRNYGYFEMNEEAMSQLKRIEPKKLEQMSRDFVKTYLSDYIPLGKNEELIPFDVKYQINTQQSIDKGSKKEEHTVAATMIFSRKVNDIDVLGKGSKIAVLYANDGTPFGFDFDWPALSEIGEKQEVISVDEIKQRAVNIAKLSKKVVNLQLDRFECGYYDAGQRKRNDTPMQSACFHFYSAQSIAQSGDMAGLLTMAFANAVPAGRSIIDDPKWDEAIELLYGVEAKPERAKPAETSPLHKKMQGQINSFKEEEPI